MRRAAVVLLALFVCSQNIQSAFAADFRMSGKILDQKNNPVTQGTVVFNDAGGTTKAATTSDIAGSYEITVPEGTYTIIVQGPKDSGLDDTTLTGQTVAASSVRDFILGGSTPVIAEKPTLLVILTPVIAGGIAALLLAAGGYIFWKRRKPLPQPGSPH